MIAFYEFKLIEQVKIIAIVHKVKRVREERNVSLRFYSGLK